MTHEIVKTEYARGHVGGNDCGTRVRIVLRSPTMFLYSGYGLRYYTRGQGYNNPHMDRIAPDAKRSTLELPKVRDEIDRLFGQGTTDILIESTKRRGFGTVLLDGGGDPLPLPRHQAHQIATAKYEDVTPRYDITAMIAQEHCLQCGKALRLKTAHHSVDGYAPAESAVRTLEQCQRLSNHTVVALHGVSINHQEHWSNVAWFETWDGESYLDETFCSDRCAARYGKRAADELPHLVVGGEPPVPRPYVPREDVNHNTGDERFVVMDGKLFKI